MGMTYLGEETKTRARWWRLGVALVAAILLVLAFGARARGLEGGAAEADRYQAKQMTLLTAIAYGQVGRESFSEREINAYLGRLLEDNAQVRQARGLQVGIEDLRCDLADQRASLFVTGRLAMIPFVLEYRVTDPAGMEDGGERLSLESAWLGRLPLVPPFNWVAFGHLRRLLAGIQSERQILEHLKAVEIAEDAVHVTVAADARLAGS